MHIFKAIMAVCAGVFLYKSIKEKNTERAYNYFFGSIGFEILALVEKII